METEVKARPKKANGEAREDKQAPYVNAPKVTIAFPFSSVALHEPRETTIELARIVAELAHEVARRAPREEVEKLAVEADELVAKMKERS